MSSHLHFGTTSFELPEDTDLDMLKTQIYIAVHTGGTGMGGWLDVPIVDAGSPTVVHLYLSPSVPVWVMTDAPYDPLDAIH